MSKNFELMQEALREALRETPAGPESNKVVFVEPEADRNRRVESSDFDALAQQECFRLVQRIFLAQPASPFRTVVFAGIDRGSGCSRICVEAARILAGNTGGSVCVVDANFRTPSLSGFFRVPNDIGLVNSLLEEGSMRSFARQLIPSNLWLVPTGSVQMESANLLNSDQLKVRLQELRKEFDFILIDAPAINPYTDALSLGRVSDGLVLVLEAEATRRESALKGLQTLRDAKVEVLGAVLNRRTFPIPDFIYRRL